MIMNVFNMNNFNEENKNSSVKNSLLNLEYSDLPKIQYQFYLKACGLIGLNIAFEKYLDSGKQQALISKLQSIYCRFVCYLIWFFTLRYFLLMFISDNLFRNLLFDLTGYWNEYRMYFLMPLFFMYLQCALTCTLFLLLEKQCGWFVPFLSLKQLLFNSKLVKLDYQMHNLRINLTILAVLILSLFLGSCFSGLLFNTAYNQLDTTTFLFYVPCLIIDSLSFFYLIFISFITVTYLNLICLLMSKRFNQVFLQIEALAESDPGPTGFKNEQINQLYFDHNEICELVDESNYFWQNYIFFTVMTYIPCNCYLIYNLLFMDYEILLALFTWFLFVITFLVLAIISGSAADVSNQAHAPYSALHTLSLLKMPIDLEVNMSTFLHRVRGSTIGYSCYDLFVITNSSVSSTIAAVVSYFLIVADFSRSTTTNRFTHQAVHNSLNTTKLS